MVNNRRLAPQAVLIAVSLTMLSCRDIIGPDARHTGNSTPPVSVLSGPSSWSGTLSANGPDPYGETTIATLSDARMVKIVINSSITLRHADGTPIRSFGVIGDAAASCKASANLVSGTTWITQNGFYCVSSPAPATQSISWATVGGEIKLRRTGGYCQYGAACPIYTGESSVEMSVVPMTPKLKEADDNGNYVKSRFVILTDGWINGTPWQVHSWKWYPEGGAMQDITWHCKQWGYYCWFGPTVPGMLEVDLTMNGDRRTTSIPINVPAGDVVVSAAPSEVYPGDSVTFTARGAPDSIAGRQVELRDIEWSWRPTGVLTPDSSARVCANRRECKIPVFGSGTMKVAANYGGRGVDSAFVTPQVAQPGLGLSAHRPAEYGQAALMASRSGSPLVQEFSRSKRAPRVIPYHSNAATPTASLLSPYVPSAAAALRVASGDSVRFTASTTPAAASVSAVSWTWVSALSDSTAVCGTQWPSCQVPVFSGGHMLVKATVRGMPKEAIATVDTGPKGVELACTPSSVIRTHSVRCTATLSGSPAAVTQWKFVPDESQTYSAFVRPDEQSSAVWEGPMIIAGRVVVSATIAGAPYSDTAAIDVGARNFSTEVVTLVHPDSGQGLLPDSAVYEDDLGSAQPRIHPDNGQMVASGPNYGFWYHDGPPGYVDVTLHFNRKELKDSSKFWLRMPSVDSQRVGFPYPHCGRPRMDTITKLVEKHEGKNGRADINSHVEIFTRVFERLVRAGGDSVYYKDPSLAGSNWGRKPWIDRWVLIAAESSATIDSAGHPRSSLNIIQIPANLPCLLDLKKRP